MTFPSSSTLRGALRSCVSFACVARLVAACGGATDSALYDPATDTGASVDASTTPPSTSHGDVDATTPPTTTNPPPATTSDASTTPDAAPTPPPDAGPVIDATAPVEASTPDATPPDPTGDHLPGTIACGTSICSIPNEICCRTKSFTGDASYACVAKGACLGLSALSIPCDDGNDCAVLGSAGEVCCASETTGTSNINDVQCRPAHDCDMANHRVTLCDPGVPVATACPNAPQGACIRNAAASFDFTLCSP